MENRYDNHIKDFLDIILNVNKSIFSTLETKDLLFLIVQKISEVIPVMRCSIVNVDKEKNAGYGIKSIIIMPIRYSDNKKASLYLRTSRKGDKFSENDLKLCQVIIDGAAVALKNAYLFNVLREEKLLLETLNK